MHGMPIDHVAGIFFCVQLIFCHILCVQLTCSHCYLMSPFLLCPAHILPYQNLTRIADMHEKGNIKYIGMYECTRALAHAQDRADKLSRTSNRSHCSDNSQHKRTPTLRSQDLTPAIPCRRHATASRVPLQIFS